MGYFVLLRRLLTPDCPSFSSICSPQAAFGKVKTSMDRSSVKMMREPAEKTISPSAHGEMESVTAAYEDLATQAVVFHYVA
jgi:hypothetical protein